MPRITTLDRGELQVRRLTLAVVLLVVPGILQAQHGTAPGGYWPMGFNGDTWRGEVSAVNDDSREITLVYSTQEKTETFVGVLQEGYKAKLKDGTLVELKVSTIHLGTRLEVYYMPRCERSTSERKNTTRFSRYTSYHRQGQITN
jgi:uncharacterized protein YfcZ (UPF0381/DUF406 family)